MIGNCTVLLRMKISFEEASIFENIQINPKKLCLLVYFYLKQTKDKVTAANKTMQPNIWRLHSKTFKYIFRDVQTI